MECSCVLVDIDEFVNLLNDRYIKSARKDHECSECNNGIKKGESYHSHSYVFHKEFTEHKFCEDCWSLKEEFLCEGYNYGMIRGDIRNHIMDSSGEISSECILNLNDGARDFVLSEIQDVFDDLNLDDDD